MRRRLPPYHIQFLPRDLPFLHSRIAVLVYTIPGSEWVKETCAALSVCRSEYDVGEDVIGYYEGGGIVGRLCDGGGIGSEAEGCEEFAPRWG